MYSVLFQLYFGSFSLHLIIVILMKDSSDFVYVFAYCDLDQCS